MEMVAELFCFRIKIYSTSQMCKTFNSYMQSLKEIASSINRAEQEDGINL